MAPAFRVKKGEEGRMLTWINDSDDDMRRHRLDDVARPLACQVVAIVCPLLQHAPSPLSVVTSPSPLALFVIVFVRCSLPGRRWRHGPCSADDMCRHCLDDLACPLTCQVITFHHCRSSVGLVTWHCHVAVVVGMHNGGGHWSNDSCARWWSLLAGASQRM
ncbi:hypothetical protein K443DRAFT_677435 [Laccaria amethystina LaAM-08-1]|uniref:Uncharacterized protein n=1 Tax=Laccaria amethystina LaAM-08-1 TaxID=1095629 RepID=A0A0C9XMD6_9AGAR|nr:hypothetical protein K443DRAFT_677435 [Laccaria amethystina LaAM-08-1]